MHEKIVVSEMLQALYLQVGVILYLALYIIIHASPIFTTNANNWE